MIYNLSLIVEELKKTINKQFFIGIPQDVINETFITLNIVSQIQNIKVNNQTRIEIRIVGANDESILNLDSIQNEILEIIKLKYRDFGFFKYEIGNLVNGFDELKRPFILRDIIFYKIV